MKHLSTHDCRTSTRQQYALMDTVSSEAKGMRWKRPVVNTSSNAVVMMLWVAPHLAPEAPLYHENRQSSGGSQCPALEIRPNTCVEKTFE